jgi:hypothetical protein
MIFNEQALLLLETLWRPGGGFKMSKFNNVNHETFQSWHVCMKDLMDQKEAWYKMVEELPERNMAQLYQHKVIDIGPFAGKMLAAEFMASKDQNNVSFYLVDENGDDDGTRFLCGNRLGSSKFYHTNDKFASDVAGTLLGYLRRNGFLTY